MDERQKQHPELVIAEGPALTVTQDAQQPISVLTQQPISVAPGRSTALSTAAPDRDARDLWAMQIYAAALLTTAVWLQFSGYFLTAAHICALLVPALLYSFFSIVKRRLRITELSPIKAAISVFVPVAFSPVAAWITTNFTSLYDSGAPMAVLTPVEFDVAILMVSMLVFSIYWQCKWVALIGARFCAIEAKVKGARVLKIPSARLLLTGLLVCLGFCAPFVWYSMILLVYARSAQTALTRWGTFDSKARQEVIQAKTKLGLTNEASTMIGGKSNQKDKELMLIRYQSSTGLEQWVRERFSEKSWKKAAFILTILALFVGFGGPLLMVQALPALFAAGSAAGGATATSATSASTAAGAASFVMLVQGCFLALVAAVATYIIKTPTHLQLDSAGLRFLWTYPLFRRRGRMVSWNSIDDIAIKRPFGKTLPQDASICLSGNGQALLQAKLKYIPSVDDKDAILHALDKWSTRSTARASDVTELLSPPADHSYTELWLQALTAPPKRERLKPLMPEAILRDQTYHVNDQIGAGGQGFAYLATDLRNNQTVVLKEYLLPIFVDMESRRRAISNFEMEARTLQSLESEQIVKLLDFFIEDHRAYLVLEHIDGESLKQLVDRIGPLKTHNVLQLASQMCEILRYLHNLTPPLVHRDFTPDNLILRPDGKLKLIDFNVAQKIENESTFTGTIVGKQAYLPAEQFRGNATTASDIYALGCCLFYLLVGHDPEPITVSHPQADRADVPEALDQITARATALEVEDRYATIDDVAAGIHQLLQEEQ